MKEKMIINYGLRPDNTFDFWQVYPIEDNLPKLEIEDPRVIELGKTKLINGVIVQPTISAEEVIETNKRKFRNYRKTVFNAFDVWEKNVLRGREEDNQEIVNWYNEMLDFTNNITEATKIADYPTPPEVIKKYV